MKQVAKEMYRDYLKCMSPTMRADSLLNEVVIDSVTGMIKQSSPLITQ